VVHNTTDANSRKKRRYYISGFYVIIIHWRVGVESSFKRENGWRRWNISRKVDEIRSFKGKGV